MMTTKLEQAARQALKALETDEQWGFVNKKVLERRLPAITALREALAEQSNHESELLMNDGEYRRKKLAEQAEQEPVERHVENVYKRGDKYFAWIGDDYVQIYTAPVRTKDLTDDEIHKAVLVAVNSNELNAMGIARVVIAADREKNRGN